MVFFLQIHTVISLYRLDGNKKFLESLVYSSYSRAFYGPELDLWNCALKFPVH